MFRPSWVAFVSFLIFFPACIVQICRIWLGTSGTPFVNLYQTMWTGLLSRLFRDKTSAKSKVQRPSSPTKTSSDLSSRSWHYSLLSASASIILDPLLATCRQSFLPDTDISQITLCQFLHSSPKSGSLRGNPKTHPWDFQQMKEVDGVVSCR